MCLHVQAHTAVHISIQTFGPTDYLMFGREAEIDSERERDKTGPDSHPYGWYVYISLHLFIHIHGRTNHPHICAAAQCHVSGL